MPTSTDSQIEVLLTANFADLATGLNGASEAVRASTDAMGTSFKAFSADAETLDAIIGKNITSFAELATAESALDRIQQSGAYSAEQLATAFKSLDAAELSLSKAAKTSTVALEGQTAATVQLGGATSAVSREMAIMTGEALRGNYSRLIGSTTVLANRTGLLAKLFSPLGLAIGATAGSMFLLGKAAYSAEERQAELNRMLVATGGALGVSEAGFNDLVQSIDESDGSLSKARDALMKVGETGKFTGEQYGVAAKAAVDMAVVTGESIDKCVSELVKLREEPVKAIAKLNESYHFLTAAQYEEIAQLDRQGDHLRAAQVAMNIYAGVMDQRAKEVEANTSAMGKIARGVKDDFVSMWEAIGHAANKALGDKGTLSQQLADAKEVAADLRRQKNSVFSWQDGSEMNAEYDAQMKKVFALSDAIKKAEEAKAKLASDRATQDAGIEGAQIIDRENAGLDRKVYKQQRYTQVVNESADALKKMHAAGMNTGGVEFDAKGDPTGKEWEQRKAAISEEVGLTKQLRSEKAAAAREAKKSAAEQLNDLKIERDGTEINSQARIDADKKVIAAAQRFSKELPNAYKSANETLLADQRGFWREYEKGLNKAAEDEIRAREESYKGDHDAAVEAIALKRQDAEDDYRNAAINALQLLAIDRKLDADLEAADRAYYTARKTLRKGDLASEQEAENEIRKSHATFLKTTEKDDQSYHDRIRREWQRTGQVIAQSMTGALKGMLFQHQAFKQGVINIAESMASEFIDKAITVPLEKWISAEAEKLAVSIHSATGKTAVENTQRATNAAADAVASAASVLRASGVAGAQDTASFAGAPWPVDMGAPAFGLAMAAASLSYLSVASAEKGWARVPYDNAPAILHKDEMVLPASLAKGVRNMSGAGGGGTVHIHTIDARGVKEFFRRNPGARAQGVKHAQRMGHLGSMT